ncbi:MAG: hypothetical protein QM737_18970 [Ferruginibacter sp.]
MSEVSLNFRNKIAAIKTIGYGKIWRGPLLVINVIAIRNKPPMIPQNIPAETGRTKNDGVFILKYLPEDKKNLLPVKIKMVTEFKFQT